MKPGQQSIDSVKKSRPDIKTERIKNSDIYKHLKKHNKIEKIEEVDKNEVIQQYWLRWNIFYVLSVELHLNLEH